MGKRGSEGRRERRGRRAVGEERREERGEEEGLHSDYFFSFF